MLNKPTKALITWFFYTSFACYLIFAIPPPVRAQNFGGFNSRITDGTAYYTYARPGEATMQIMVLGSSGSSGIYEVGETTTLDQLLALSGAVSMASTSQERKTRVTIRLYRESQGNREAIYEAPIKSLLLEPDKHPSLQEGDVLTIETVELLRFHWRDVISILSSAVSIIWIIDRISN